MQASSTYAREMYALQKLSVDGVSTCSDDVSSFTLTTRVYAPYLIKQSKLHNNNIGSQNYLDMILILVVN